MPDFTEITVNETYILAGGSDNPARGAVHFLLTTALTNASTGARITPTTVTAQLDPQGRLLDPDTGTVGVHLVATNDPTTTPVGATYRVTEQITGTDPPRVYYITLPYNAPSGTVILGLLVPGTTAPAVHYELTGITMPAPFLVTRAAGLDNVTWDSALGDVGQVLTRTADGAEWDDATGGGSAGHVIQDEGTPLTARPALNFTGAGVTATDNAGSNRTDVTIAGGVSLGSSTPLGDAGAGSAGSAGTSAHSDHAHPLSPAYAVPGDVTAEAAARASGDSTNAAALTTHAALTDTAHGGIPALSSTTPAATARTGAVGVGTTAARPDHVHPIIPFGMVWKDEWDGTGATTYVPGDAVIYLSYAYVCIATVSGNPGNDPPSADSDHWTRLGAQVRFSTPDNSPNIAAIRVEFPNGTLTDSGTGVATYTPAGGALTVTDGDAVTVENVTTLYVLGATVEDEGDGGAGILLPPDGVLISAEGGSVVRATVLNFTGGGVDIASQPGGTYDVVLPPRGIATSDDSTTVEGTVLLIVTGAVVTDEGDGVSRATITPASVGAAETVHTHSEGDVTALVSDLAGKASTTHASTHITGGSDLIANAVPGGAAGLFSGANATKLGQFAPTSGKTLTVSNSLTLAGTDGDTATIPAGGGTLSVSGHTHAESSITNLVSDLAALAPKAGLVRPWKVNYFQGPPCSSSTGAKVNGQVTYQPLVVTQAQSIDQILIETTVAGSAGSVTRVGIFNSTSDGLPGTVLLDAGTLDSTVTAGILTKTLGTPQALAPGIYWLAAVTQGAPSTTPTYRTNSGALPGVQGEVGNAAGVLTNTANGYFQSSVTGAFGTAAIGGAVGSAVRIAVRCSA